MANRHQPRAKQSNRNTRLAEQIQKDLAQLIQREFNPASVGLITLSRVELSADYAHAKVYFTVLGAEPEVAEDRLNDRAGYLHAQLFKLLHIHTVPSLLFIHDAQLVEGEAMRRLIDRAVGKRGPDDEGDPAVPLDETKIRG